jgi:hypothetical protein
MHQEAINVLIAGSTIMSWPAVYGRPVVLNFAQIVYHVSAPASLDSCIAPVIGKSGIVLRR